MSEASVEHDTFVLDRTFAHPAARVFAAFSDPAKKQHWYARSDMHDVVRYDLNFATGGTEVLVGRMREGTPIAGAHVTWTQTFADIVDGERIVFTQTVDMGDRRISCAVITIELDDRGAEGCGLKLTHQAVFFHPADGPAMRKLGWEALLDSLASAIA